MIGANAPAGSDDRIGRITTVPSLFSFMVRPHPDIINKIITHRHLYQRPCTARASVRCHGDDPTGPLHRSRTVGQHLQSILSQSWQALRRTSFTTLLITCQTPVRPSKHRQRPNKPQQRRILLNSSFRRHALPVPSVTNPTLDTHSNALS